MTKDNLKQLIKEIISEIIHDRFSNLPLTKQRKWQLRREKENNCIICGEPAVVSRYCLKHAIAVRERQRQRIPCQRIPRQRRNYGSRTYKLQQSL